MDTGDALQALGLTGTTEFDPAALKRAYLRQVKTHPPEADPAGFQRVREAYEHLRSRPVKFPVQRATEPSLPRARTTHEALDHDRVFEQPIEPLEEDNGSPEVGPTSQVPAPPLALGTILRSFAVGEKDRAQQLFAAFEQHLAVVAVPLAPALGAEWRLLNELNAISEFVSRDVVCTLALSIEAGQFGSVSLALDENTKLSKDQVLELIRARAPTLFQAAIGPGVEFKAFSNKVMFWFGIFAVFMLILLGNAVTRSCSVSGEATRDNLVDRSRTEFKDFAKEAASAAPATVEVHELANADREQVRELIQKTEQAYLVKKCDALLVAWAEYFVMAHRLREAGVSREYVARRARTVALCPTLALEIPEQP